MADSGRRVGVLGRVALILGGVLVAALMAEIGLRTIYTIPEVANPLYSFHESDPVIGWRGKRDWKARFRRPDFDALIAHGPDGWRRGEPPPPAHPSRRVLFLGDSFTWGWGVSQGELFSDVLQRRMPAGAAVYNRGINGVGTSQEYLLMKQELDETTYDAVALMFFHNDIADNVGSKGGRRPLFELEGDTLVPRNQPPARLLNPIERTLKDHSRAFQFADVQISMFLRSLDDDPEPTVDPTDVDYLRLPGAPVTIRLLEEMQRLAVAHGTQFVIVYLPHISEFETGPSIYPYIRAVRALLRDVADRQGIPLIDLTAAFQQGARQGRTLVFPHDEHWTPAGHEVVAEALLASPLFTQLHRKKYQQRIERIERTRNPLNPFNPLLGSEDCAEALPLPEMDHRRPVWRG